MPEASVPAIVAPERTMPKPVIAAGLVLVGVLLGVGLSAKLLPVRKVLYPVEGPPRPCKKCEERETDKVPAPEVETAIHAQETVSEEAADETAPAPS